MENVSLSQANNIYLMKQKQPVENTIAMPEKTDTKKKAKIIGAVALGTIAIGGLIAFGKYKSAQKLADYIEFKPAQTLEEAKNFAQKHLKVKTFSLTDLDSANYVNEALANFNNNISINHRRIVASIEPMKGEAIASIGSTKVSEGFLFFNEEQFRDIDSVIESFLKEEKITLLPESFEKYDLTGEQKSLISSWIDEIKRQAMTKKEKLQFLDFINLFNIKENHTTKGAWFSNLLNGKNMVEFLKANNFPVTIEDFSKLDDKEQSRICTELINQFGKKLRIQSGGPFQTINHEIGHVLHKENAGEKAYEDMIYYSADSTRGEIEKAARRFISEIGDAKYYDIEGNISAYALTDPTEFVAETYSYLCNGVKFPDNIMELYKKFRGVIPKCIQ